MKTTRRTIAATTAGALAALLLAAGPAAADPPSCNWGRLTAENVTAGFDQGGHSSDPSGDGRGPEARVGLANVVNKGDMEATCELIDSLL